jgi:hypothetical protein
MNRYWDDAITPRQESYKEDLETGEKAVKYMLAVSLFKNASQQKKQKKQNGLKPISICGLVPKADGFFITLVQRSNGPHHFGNYIIYTR